MQQQRFTNLAILCIEKETVNKVRVEDILNKCALVSRKILLV